MTLEGCESLYCKQKAVCYVARELSALRAIRGQLPTHVFENAVAHKKREAVIYKCPNKP